MLKLILLTLIAGGAIPAGAGIAMIERLRPRWLEEEFRHSVIAFGGGALLSAVALVLVPDGAQQFSAGWTVGLFCMGGVAFMLLDRLIGRIGGSASQLVAMLSDFLPETLALGATFATDTGAGLLLALLIALQNLPEGFNAYRELRSNTSMKPTRILACFAAIALLGPVVGVIGAVGLEEHPGSIGGVMLFAAGGILYLTFEDIAPQARLERAYAPALGAVLGFALGLLGHELLAG